MTLKNISLVCLFLILFAGFSVSSPAGLYGNISISDLIAEYAPKVEDVSPKYDILAYITIKSISTPEKTSVKCINGNSCDIDKNDIIFTDAFGYEYKEYSFVTNTPPLKLEKDLILGVKFTVKYPLAYKGLSMGLSMGLKAINSYLLFNILPPPAFSTIVTEISFMDYGALVGAGIYSDNAYGYIVEDKFGGINPKDLEMPQEVPEDFKKTGAPGSPEPEPEPW